MKKQIRLWLQSIGLIAAGSTLAVVFAFSSLVPVSAADAATCKDVGATIVKCDDSGKGPLANLISQIIDFLAIGVGIAVVGGIVWGSLIYVMSNGESAKTQQGVTIIVNSVIGLIVFIFAYALINFIVPGGAF